jgi:hypothetical protein
MADHLLALERGGASMAMYIPRRELPVVVVSSGDQSPDLIAAHRTLAESSLAVATLRRRGAATGCNSTNRN